MPGARLKLRMKSMIVLIAVVALMTFGGIMTWRRRHFQTLADNSMKAAADAERFEQILREDKEEDLARFRDDVARTNREIAKLKYVSSGRLSGFQRQGHEAAAAVFDSMIQSDQHMLNYINQMIESAVEARRRHESLARRCQDAASRPWASFQPED